MLWVFPTAWLPELFKLNDESPLPKPERLPRPSGSSPLIAPMAACLVQPASARARAMRSVRRRSCFFMYGVYVGVEFVFGLAGANALLHYYLIIIPSCGRVCIRECWEFWS